MRRPSARLTRCIADIAEVIETRFWEPQYGASAEEFREDWTSFSDYRGQNANMHLTEALMAAFEATGEREFLDQGRAHRRSHPAPRGGGQWLARA